MSSAMRWTASNISRWKRGWAAAARWPSRPPCCRRYAVPATAMRFSFLRYPTNEFQRRHDMKRLLRTAALVAFTAGLMASANSAYAARAYLGGYTPEAPGARSNNRGEGI